MEKASLKKYFTHMDLDNSGKNRIFKIGSISIKELNEICISLGFV